MIRKYKRFRFVFLLCMVFVLLDGILIEYLRGYHVEEPGIDQTILQELIYFPIPASTDPKAQIVTFEDSWRDTRTFGGDRTHEGCDLMPGSNQRGRIPVLSVSDGCIEKLGWLRLGGYRVGIRSDAGTYFYYAHLSDYMPGIAEGQQIAAGECIGFMGDTGYSEVEGTTGNFPVHLHFGMYIMRNGKEEAMDPYPYLMEIVDRKLSYNCKEIR